jgi:PAS domain S-box-containing protein
MELGSGMSQRVVDAARDGLWVFDSSGTTTFANARMAGLLGRPREEVVGRSALDHLDEAGRAQFREYLAALSAAPQDDEGDDGRAWRLVRPDGTTTDVTMTRSPLRDDSGQRVGWLHQVSERAGQAALLESLRQRERLLAVAQSIARIGSWEWDVTTDTVTWSDQLYRIYGVDPAEFEATYHGFLGFIHPEDRPMVEEAVASVFRGDAEFAWDARIVRRDGEQRWVRGLGRAERAPDGRPLRMGGTAQDITERVLADRQAAEATRRLHLLEGMATAANRTNSLEEAVRLAAARVPEFTSWQVVCLFRSEEDGPGEPVDLTQPSAGWLPEPDPELADRARRSGRVEVGSPAGHEQTHSVVALPVLHDGEAVCVIELLADEVPPDEHSQALMAQIAQQLGQVAHREASAAALAVARDQAMEASRLKSEFLATMTHEIRTPMNGVIGLNDLLLQTDLDRRQRQLAEGLQSAGLTLLGIINDILDLSKIEAGKLELEALDFDVRAVFEKTLDVLAGPAHERGLELVVACHPDVPDFLRGDPGRLGQVLANLGSNAVKFTDEGEVSIRAQVAEETDDSIVLAIEVTDTGVGIAPEHHARLFDAFTQADPSTTRKHGGTGLGLAISRELVSALGGTLHVDSEAGKGSTFSFTASFGRATSAPRGKRRTGPELLRGRRVLVVDDNATNRLILGEQLAAWEMDPVAVGTADEALAALRSAAATGNMFDVALLDLLLPDGDGLALARAIRAGTGHRGLHLLLLSSAQHVDADAARAADVSRVLTKPVRHSELFDSLVDAVATVGDAAPRPGHEEAGAPSAGGGRGRRVLVVEDNEVNQMVATGLLEARGFTVDVVNDGVEAVAALTGDHGYAAVLMDCRMPRLDGYDATREIRAREPDGERVPIIAMTASALEGERDRCLAVGMDGFLTKPVDPVQLFRVLQEWTGGGSPAAESTPAEPDLDRVVDLERMRMLDSMRRDGTSLFDRAAANFGANAPGQLEAIRAAVTAADAANLVATAHKLKGSATNLGLPAVGEAAAALEHLGDSGTTHGAEELFSRLTVELDTALAALASLVERGL